MKKIYISPEMEIIDVEAQQTLLAGSVAFDVEDTTIPAESVDAPLFGDGDLEIFED